MNEQQPKPDKKKEDKAVNAVATVLTVAVFIAVPLLIVLWITGVFSSGKHAKYQATLDISNAVVVNPATLSVAFHVKNVGNAPGSPTCTIDVSDPSGTYSGQDMLTNGPTIQPGKTSTSADQITITKQGAQYVTTGKITCS